MFLVDSHCHLDQLDLTNYSNDLSKALAYANEQGVKHFLCVSTVLKEFDALLEIAKSYPNVSASLGLHPNELDIDHEPSVTELVQLAQNEKIVAIGETGLDYYRSTGDLEWQRERFRRHIQAAKQLNKPLIIHTRQARADTIQILKEEDASFVGGVMHCFTEDWATAKAALELGFVISFSGIVTFQNAKEIQDVAKNVPLNQMLIETDSPYLAPVPYRGKPNEPAYVCEVAKFIAELRGINVVELAEQTTENFFRVFKLAKR
ncbi:MAG TPA: TatD family hydrolase [Gammaproteobacteria bacterium]|nr:TatD family hydrolase [Gammaproteobacteria bacterium]